MNFLSIVQRLHQEIGGGPGDPGTLPATVVTQSGELLRYVTWCQQAFLEIQNANRDWRWMTLESTADVLGVGAKSLTLTGTIVARLDEIRPYISDRRQYVLFYEDAVGPTDAQWTWMLPWQDFHGYYDSGRFDATQGRPQFASLGPDGRLYVWPTADKDYRAKYPFRREPQELLVDADTPILPEKWHMLIVYLALCYYARSNESNRIMSWLGNGLNDFSVPSSPLVKLYNQMCGEQLPAINYLGAV